MREAIWTLDEIGDAADLFIAILSSPRRMTISRAVTGETPRTRRLEPLPLHRDRRRHFPGVIEQLDLPMFRPMEASRTNETADSDSPGEMARGWAGAVDRFAHVRGRSFPRSTERGVRFRDLQVHEFATVVPRPESSDSGSDRRFHPERERPSDHSARGGASLVPHRCSQRTNARPAASQGADEPHREHDDGRPGRLGIIRSGSVWNPTRRTDLRTCFHPAGKSSPSSRRSGTDRAGVSDGRCQTGNRLQHPIAEQPRRNSGCMRKPP